MYTIKSPLKGNSEPQFYGIIVILMDKQGKQANQPAKDRTKYIGILRNILRRDNIL